MPTERQIVAQRTTWISIAINSILVVGQLIVGVIAHSQALIADGIHSLSDLIADGIVLVASKRGAAGPDHDHNYGHSRYETVASFFLGGLLIAVGLGMLWRAGHRLSNFDGIPDVQASALYVAVVAIVVKEGLFRFMLREAERVRSSLLIANAWHARSDAASSLVVSLGVLGSLLGFKVLDPIAASIVGFMIARMGWTFGWNALQDLSDRALDEAATSELGDVLRATQGVRAVHELKTRKMGDSALVDAHLLVDPKISVSEGHYIAESARARLKRDPRVLDVMIHIDPENDDEVQPTRVGLPMRPELLARARRLLKPLGIPVETIELHYLDSGIDVDVYISATLREWQGQMVVMPRDAESGEGATSPAMADAAAVTKAQPTEPLASAHHQWRNLDADALAQQLGVRKVRFFFSLQ
jgi:cation diffusion facilitator family transporter